MDTTIVYGGIDFGEGPRWRGGALWFSDFYQHVVRRGRPDGEVTVEATVPGQPSELALVHPDGRAEVAASDPLFPNGAVITPDGSTLIVGETVGSQYTGWDIGPEGALGNRRVWAETPGRFPDGCTMDAEGGIWFADPGGNECVRVVEGGEITDRIEASQTCFACALGGDDLDTLYVLTAPASGPGEVGGKALGRLEAVGIGRTG